MNDYSYDSGYDTSYNAGGAAGAGGFVQGDIQSSPAGGRANFSKETIRPVTVKQLFSATRPHPDAEFKIDGEIIPQVTFVGQIRNINKQTTNTTYKVDDGTGIMEVKEWKDADSMDDVGMDSGKPKLEDGGYCRVWGKLKEFYDKKTVQAFVIRPITDRNEINYHLLEATYVHLFFKNGPTTDNNERQTGQNGQADGGGSMKVDGRELPSHLSPRAKMVYKYLRESPQSNEGQHVQLIASGMGLQVNDVYRAAEELVEAGLTFTTVDENTWAVLDF